MEHPGIRYRVQVMLLGGTIVEGYTYSSWTDQRQSIDLTDAKIVLSSHPDPYSTVKLKTGPDDLTTVPRHAVLLLTTFNYLKHFEED